MFFLFCVCGGGGVSDGYLSLPVGSEAYFLVILYNVYLKKLEFTGGGGAPSTFHLVDCV